jgi:hypothetical protein
MCHTPLAFPVSNRVELTAPAPLGASGTVTMSIHKLTATPTCTPMSRSPTRSRPSTDAGCPSTGGCCSRPQWPPRSPTTPPWRPISENATRSRGYRPFDAHRRATARRARNHRRRIEANGELRQVVAELLAQRWSPQQISRHLRLKFPEQSGMWLCHESIYQAVYQPGSGLLRPSRLAPHHRSPLRTGRDHRRAHQRTERRRPRFEYPMLTIHQRPFPPEDRSQPGHWESQ